jgi:post-segregation antitoxin (ccd killing protein)
MRMARVNVYLPDELAARARAAQLNVSALAQEALRTHFAREATDQWLERVRELPRHGVDHAQVIEALEAAREELGGDR